MYMCAKGIVAQQKLYFIGCGYGDYFFILLVWMWVLVWVADFFLSLNLLIIIWYIFGYRCICMQKKSLHNKSLMGFKIL